ncbi:6259_t:CDS:1, partial [Acaulospora colombiana]
QGQEIRRRKEEERVQHQMMDQGHHHAVKVTAPTSFFDTSPFEERRAHHASSSHGVGGGSGPVMATSQQPTDVRINVPHPYHQHYRQSVGPLDQIANVGGDTAVPMSPSYDFSHPYANTPPATVISSPRSNVIRNSHLAPSVVRKNTLDSNRDGGGREAAQRGEAS